MRKSVITLLSSLLIFGCASAPIQEMSDARQAINAARQVMGASTSAALREDFQRAETLLEDAETQLRAGEYSKARRYAEEAKLLAIEARERAGEAGGSH